MTSAHTSRRRAATTVPGAPLPGPVATSPDVGPAITFGVLAVVFVVTTHLVLHGPVRDSLLLMSDRAAAAGLTTLSVVHLLLGVTVFFRIGGRAVTPIGVYFFAAAVFFGYAGLAPGGQRVPDQYMIYASLTGLVFNVCVLGIAKRMSRTGSSVAATNWNQTRTRARRATPVGRPMSLPVHFALWSAFTLAAPIARSVPILGGYAEFIQIALGLLLLEAFLRNSRSEHPLRFAVGVPIIGGLIVGTFLTLYFGGGARIVVGAFVMAVAILVGQRFRWLPLKPLILAGLLPGLIWAAVVRSEMSVAEARAGIVEARGVTSATSTLPILAEVLERHDTIGLDDYAHRGGRTFYVTSVVFVPREWWPEKPTAPEIELAQLLYPEVAFGFSIVGTNVVEWILNFDVGGLIPGAILTGLVLGRTEQWVRKRPSGGTDTPHASVKRALVTGNLVMFAWAGSFSFTARTFVGLLTILALDRLARIARLPGTTGMPRR
jgi:hypothetical protein